MSTAIISEFKILIKKRHIYILFGINLLIIFFAYRCAKSELNYLKETNQMMSLAQSTFPSIVNGIMFVSIIFMGTVFMLVGFLDAHLECKNQSINQRLIMFGSKKIVLAKVITWYVIASLSMILVLLSAVAAQNRLYKDQAIIADFPETIGYLTEKLLMGILVLGMSAFIGIIIDQFFDHVGIGILICLGIDQWILAKTPIQTKLMYAVFRNSNFLVQATHQTYKYSQSWIYIISLLMCIISVTLIFMMTYRKR